MILISRLLPWSYSFKQVALAEDLIGEEKTGCEKR